MIQIQIPQVNLKKSNVTKVHHSFIEFYPTYFIIKVKYQCLVVEKDEYEVEHDIEKFFYFEELYIRSKIAGIDQYYNFDEDKYVVKILVGENPIIVFNDKKAAKEFTKTLSDYVVFGKMPMGTQNPERSVATEAK